MSICFCAAGCGSNPMADPGVWPECHCWCHDKDRDKPGPGASNTREGETVQPVGSLGNPGIGVDAAAGQTWTVTAGNDPGGSRLSLPAIQDDVAEAADTLRLGGAS